MMKKKTERDKNKKMWEEQKDIKRKKIRSMKIRKIQKIGNSKEKVKKKEKTI